MPMLHPVQELFPARVLEYCGNSGHISMGPEAPLVTPLRLHSLPQPLRLFCDFCALWRTVTACLVALVTS